MDIKYAIIQDNLRPSIPKNCPEDIVDLLERCWHSNPQKRPKFDEIAYILSMQLEMINGADSHGDNSQMKRRHISISLNSELCTTRSCKNLSNPQIEGSSKDTYAIFTKLVESTDRFISCIEVIPQSNEVWTGTSDGAIVIRDGKVKKNLKFA